MKILRTSFRILVGLIFVFSGFVKGIDPLGTVFRMNDYFIAFGAPWAAPTSIYLSILLCVAEFITGISLLFNLWIRNTAWILLPLMTFFTILTFFDAAFNLVPDCGCFGDAIKLSNTATFIKNLILMGFVVPIFLWRNKFKSALPIRSDLVILLTTTVAFVWLSIWCYRHLPLIDFMDWKVGNKVSEVKVAPVKFYVTYKNKVTGEIKEYLAPDYPWNDSTWLAEWEFVDQRVEDVNVTGGSMLKAEDLSGNDMTSRILHYPKPQFLLVSWDLEKANINAFRRVLPLYKKATADEIPFICLTSALPEEIRQFRIKHVLPFEFLNADDVVLKTMVRSNPGLILLNKGKVVAKWSFRDFPTYEQVKKDILR
jgi:uncharacterized membrane protein YphA (DoxX/SURF4 family)